MTEELNHRFLPSSIEAESGILSVALNDPVGAYKACSALGLRKEHFYHPGPSLLYGVLCEFWEDNEPVDSQLIVGHMRRHDMLSVCGGRVGEHQSTGAAYVTELCILNCFPGHLPNYVGIVKEAANRRKSIISLQKALEAAYNQSIEGPEFFAEAEGALIEVVKLKEGEKIQTRDIYDLVHSAVDQFEASLKRSTPDMPTGIWMLDRYTGGFVAPAIWVIMARSSQGKSALAVNFMEHLAVDCGKRIGYISLEMGAVQLISRMLFSRASLNPKEIETRRYMTDNDRARIVAASEEIISARNRIFIREDGGLTDSEISATASAWKAQYGLDALFIDHAQLAKVSHKTSGRTEEVEAISRSLKPLAKRLGIPIIILSQVTVKEGRNGEADSYSAKNSKALEEDADVAITISHNKETGSWLHISKNREGERDVSVPVIWSPETQRFSDRHEQVAEQPNLMDLPPAVRNGRK